MEIQIAGLTTLPAVKPGDDLTQLILEAARRENRNLDKDTIVVIAQKVVSKAEDAIVDLRTINPSPFAASWARQWNKDARLIELVLRQSRRVVRMDRGVLIVETHHGLVAANAGVDLSNAPADCATVLPDNPDASARNLRIALACGAVVISDTFGRPWRNGLVNVAIGISGMEALEDERGETDLKGWTLSATVTARADELAAAAGLVMSKSSGVPVVLIRGFQWKSAEGSAHTLLRVPEQDLFR